MKVSIITPSYNQAQFLETTIRSVLSQGCKDLEYFIIDGGSSDGSLEIIRKYEDRLSFWISEPDKGQADAINKGFKKATGDVIAWINSDDAYAPGAIQSAIKEFLKRPDVGLIYGNSVSMDQHGVPFHLQSFNEYSLKDLVAFNIICQPAVFFRKEILAEAGFLDHQFHFLLDHHLWLRIAQRTNIHHVSEIWAFARYHPGAKNIRLAPEFGKEAFKLLDWMRGEPDLVEIITQNQKVVMATFHRFVGRYLLDGGQGLPALRSYLRSFQADPKVALKEWHRIIFAGLQILGLGRLDKLYYRLRNNNFSPSLIGSGVENVDRFFLEMDF